MICRRAKGAARQLAWLSFQPMVMGNIAFPGDYRFFDLEQMYKGSTASLRAWAHQPALTLRLAREALAGQARPVPVRWPQGVRQPDAAFDPEPNLLVFLSPGHHDAQTLAPPPDSCAAVSFASSRDMVVTRGLAGWHVRPV